MTMQTREATQALTHAMRDVRHALDQAHKALEVLEQRALSLGALVAVPTVKVPTVPEPEPESAPGPQAESSPTVLSGVMDYLNFLQESQGLSEQAHAYVSDAVMDYLTFLQDGEGGELASGMSSAELLSLINDLMQYAQVLQGDYKVNITRVPLRETIQQIHESLVGRAKSKGLDYELIFKGELPEYVQVDGNALSQVLLELLGNAIKFTSNGHVHLRVSVASLSGTQGVLRLSVADSGLGIDPQNQERIFEPFVQLTVSEDASQDEDQQGHGLGLAMVQSMAQTQGASIQVVSCLGVGSTFELEWPIKVATSPKETAPTLMALAPLPSVLSRHLAADGGEVASTSANGRSARVLVVDDHQLNRMVAISALKRGLPHVQIEEAKNGAEAFEKMSNERYDLVLMDLVMPDRSGIDVVQAVRALPKPFAEVPVVALTANVSDDAMAQCKAVGMEGVLAKPLDADLLVKTVLTYIHPPS